MDECETIFCCDFDCDTDDFDEVDASPVITVIDREIIPETFSLRCGSIKTQSYVLLPTKWGTLVTSVVETSGILGLVSFRGAPLYSTTAPALIKKLLHSSQLVDQITPMRWFGRYLLLSFTTTEVYANWGNQLIQGQLAAGNTHQIAALEPAIFCQVPKAVVSVVAENTDFVSSVVDPIMCFSSNFTYMHVTLNHCPPVLVTEDTMIPHLGLVMMFDGKNQNLALKTLDKFRHPPWQPIALPSKVKEVLDPGSEFFRNNLGGPVLGVDTGCPQSGVRIMVFVKSEESFEKMVQFYTAMLGVKAVARIVKSAKTSYAIFPVTRRSELMVAYLDMVKVGSVSGLVLHINVHTANNTEYDEGGSCKLTDPDGNSVVAFSTGVCD